MPNDDALYDEMQEAFWGAYDAAPSGEGVMGGSDFGCRAVILVMRGLTAPEAVAKAIGERGTYGRPRRHGLIPRPAHLNPLRSHGVIMWFDSDEERDQAIAGVKRDR